MPIEFQTKIHDYLNANTFGTELILSNFFGDAPQPEYKNETITKTNSFLDRTQSNRGHNNYRRETFDVMQDLVGRVGMTFQVPTGECQLCFVIASVHPNHHVVGIIFPHFILDSRGVLRCQNTLECKQDQNTLECKHAQNTLVPPRDVTTIVNKNTAFRILDSSVFSTLYQVHYISLLRSQWDEFHIYYPCDLSTDIEVNHALNLCDYDRRLIRESVDSLSWEYLSTIDSCYWND